MGNKERKKVEGGKNPNYLFFQKIIVNFQACKDDN